MLLPYHSASILTFYHYTSGRDHCVMMPYACTSAFVMTVTPVCLSLALTATTAGNSTRSFLCDVMSPACHIIQVASYSCQLSLQSMYGGQLPGIDRNGNVTNSVQREQHVFL